MRMDSLLGCNGCLSALLGPDQFHQLLITQKKKKKVKGDSKNKNEAATNALTLYRFIQSFFDLLGMFSAIRSHLSGTVVGNVFRACSSNFCSSADQGAGFTPSCSAIPIQAREWSFNGRAGPHKNLGDAGLTLITFRRLSLVAARGRFLVLFEFTKGRLVGCFF